MIKTFFYRIICGFALGFSGLAPGFSGSVIAIILGVYQDILDFTSNPFKNFKKNFAFLLPTGIGMAISAVLFVFVFSYFVESYEKTLYFLFLGLIAGNLPVIYKEIKKVKFKMSYLAGGTVAFAIAVVLGVISVTVNGNAEEAAVAIGTISVPLMIISGIVVGASLLMPGMSVSSLLVTLGTYSGLLLMAKSLLKFDFTHLLAFGLFGISAVAALIFTSKGIKVIFEKVAGLANSAVFGFMAGSVVGIFIQGVYTEPFGYNWLSGSLSIITGFAFSMMFVFIGKAVKKS